jgi:hypothetical protein
MPASPANDQKAASPGSLPIPVGTNFLDAGEKVLIAALPLFAEIGDVYLKDNNISPLDDDPKPVSAQSIPSDVMLVVHYSHLPGESKSTTQQGTHYHFWNLLNKNQSD